MENKVSRAKNILYIEAKLLLKKIRLVIQERK